MILSFQPACQQDIPVIYQQAKHLIDTYEDIASIDYEKVLAWVNRKITSCISEYTAVSKDGKICAYYHLCEDGELDDVYVLPQFQGQGIGSAILERSITQCQKPLYLYVFSGNHRAISFYKRFGFMVTKTLGNTRYIMSRNG